MEKFTKPDLIEQLRPVLTETLPDEPVVVAYLFEGKTSIEEQIRMERKVQEEIYRRCELENVDVRFLNNRSLMFQGRALLHRIVLHCRDEPARVAYETRVRELYFDFLPVAERHRKVFFERLRQEGLASLLLL